MNFSFAAVYYCDLYCLIVWLLIRTKKKPCLLGFEHTGINLKVWFVLHMFIIWLSGAKLYY
jgi:hypothetical protein